MTDRGEDARPVVALPSGGPSAGAVVIGLVVLALGLFVFLEGRREHAAARHAAPRPLTVEQDAPPAASPPPLALPAAPPPPAPAAPPALPPPEIRYIERAGPPVIQYVDRPAPAPQRPAGQSLVRLSEPALVIDNSDDAAAQGQPTEDAAAQATVLHHKATIVPQGTLIPAVLETPIDSSQAGPVRAITSTDTRGFDGTRVLIPRGSRLVGEYRSDTQAGQTRVLVTWSRVVRPDGVSVRLTSPAADAKGGPGLPGAVDNHLIARMGSAVLQSVFAAGVDLASRPSSGGVVVQAPAQVASGGQMLLPSGDAKPTIKVRQGSEITAFISRNLDFSGALPR